MISGRDRKERQVVENIVELKKGRVINQGAFFLETKYSWPFIFRLLCHFASRSLSRRGTEMAISTRGGCPLVHLSGV